ncbi:MAG: phosphohydrolase [Bacteroidetes bacterium HGW-Bacteroidetes-1]|jgi:uncharacterized protein|nr:MAG: phosphohydrolase [Bacteroidetes bacterium HGW-Bacteroidetes-1]
MTLTYQEKLLSKTIQFVKEQLEEAESGHDWWHIHRVHTTAVSMAQHINANKLVVELGALLHDIADSKFHDGNEELGPAIVRSFLLREHLDEETINEVVFIIENMAFKRSFHFDGAKSIEFKIVQDADRLDAIGAIGIARAFSYGGYKGRPFFDPEVLPETHNDGEHYKASKAPTINHFYEKLLLLKDQMNTEEGKKRALVRHEYMLGFLKQFDDEWKGIL